MTRFDSLWLLLAVVGLCAFLWALNATTMARFDRIEFEQSVRDAVPVVPQRREAWA